MKTIKLIVAEDKETGELGFMLEGTPIIQYPMVATEGLLVAHDIIEHQQGAGSIGSIGDELIALGGVWFTRGQYGDISRDGRGSVYSPEQNLASDLVNMGCMFNYGTPLRETIKNTHKTRHDEAFIEIINIAKKDIKDEIDAEDINQSRLDEYFNACLHLMRTGYRKAAKRFKGYMEANNIFWNIQQAVQDCVNLIEIEGQEFKLSYCSDYAVCNEIYLDEGY